MIDLLAGRHQMSMQHRVVSPTDERPAAVYGDYLAGEATVRLVMPLTMMNESGDALRALRPAPDTLLIVCDDVNLPLGTIRFRPDGGAGGHQGVLSCLDALGTEAVARLRIGIGVLQVPKDLREFVLAPFHPEERPLVKRVLEQAAEACELWVQGGIEVAMNRYNGALVE